MYSVTCARMGTGASLRHWPPATSQGSCKWAIAALKHLAQVQAGWQGRLLKVPGSSLTLNTTQCRFWKQHRAAKYR